LSFEQASLFDEPASPAPATATMPVLPTAAELDPPLQPAEPVDETRFRCRTVEEDRLLEKLFPRPECTLALADRVYGELAEIGMRAKDGPLRPSDWFEISRAELAAEVGVRERTLNPYLKALREGGLLERRRHRQGKNHYRLPRYRVDSRTATSRHPNDQGRRPVANQPRSGLATGRQPLQEKESQEEGKVIPLKNRAGVTPGRDFSRFDRVVRR
jgi:DNA-binding transcriptional ArsR family regulator